MNFRSWCHEKWMEHQDELASYGQKLTYTSKDYFQMYRWWLKREYQFQKSREQS